MFTIDKEKCTGCAICIDYCPVGAIVMKGDKAEINYQCIDCGKCVDMCPKGAISLVQEQEPKQRYFSQDQGQMYGGFNFNIRGRGLGRGMGRGLGRGPRDGRGRGRGGKGRWR
jgi:NAD-dependent dihydropyrimidine dehydrogenase PreA subunit